MTISSTTRKAGPFVGNDIATVLPFAFKVFAASDLVVVRAVTATGVETTLVLNTDYTVSLNADQDATPGGNVTLLAALATGTTAVITSAIALTQPTDLTNQGGFYPRVITNALDRLTIIAQQLLGVISRSITFPLSDAAPNGTLPAAAQRAGKSLVFDGAGNVAVDDSVALAAASAAAAAASATASEGSRDAIDNRIYPGTYAADPSTRPDGSAVQAGDYYFNSTANLHKRYNGATWVASDINSANLAASTGSTLVGHLRQGASAGVTVQAELRALAGEVADLTVDSIEHQQDLNYAEDSIGFGISNADFHMNGSLRIGAIRNVGSFSEGVTNHSAVSATKDATQSITYRGITLERVHGSNFYSALSTNLAGTSVALTAGKKYLVSCYAINLSDSEKFGWMRACANSTSFGHGAKLMDRNVRRRWALVQATSASAVDPMQNPTVALGSGAGENQYWQVLNRSSESFDVRIGGFMIEQVPDGTKQGVAVIGDSTVAGSAAKIDLLSSTEWTRWAEAILNVPFFNRGVGGETTASMDARWATDMTPLAVNASHAIIQGGINDIVQGRTLVQIQTSIASMYAKAVADGMQPIICTCTPTSSIAATPAYETLRQQLNAWIKQTYALVLDLDKVVRDPIQTSLLRQKTGWVGDGVHFDTAAKRAIGQYVAAWPFWNFIKPSSYQERPGNGTTVDAVRSGALYHLGSGYESIDVSGGTATNLRNDTRQTAQVINLTGALTAGKDVFFQGYIPKLWFVRNSTTGAFTLSIRGVDSAFSAIAGTFSLTQGKGCWVLSTGTGVVQASAEI